MALPSMTLAELRTAARQRSDMVNSTFVSDAEFNSYIQLSCYELYDLLVQKYGDDYFVKASPSAISTDGINDHFSLPTDFYKLLGVDLLLSGSGATARYLSLRPFNFSERNSAGPGFVAGPRTNLRYRLNGSKLWISPFPPSGLSLVPQYVTTFTAPTADGTSVDMPGGWLEYVICDAAIKALQKEESDVSFLMAQKAALIARIESAAENRDAGSPATVADVRRDGGDGEWYP